jgi:hypothetical protein
LYLFLKPAKTSILVPKRREFSAFSRLALRERYAYVPREWAALAQLVEHRIRNAGVGCSSHPGGTIFIHKILYDPTDSRAKVREGAEYGG